MTDAEQVEIFNTFLAKILDQHEPDSEVEKLIEDNFWELV